MPDLPKGWSRADAPARSPQAETDAPSSLPKGWSLIKPSEQPNAEGPFIGPGHGTIVDDPDNSLIGLARRALRFGAQSAISNIGGMGESGREAVESPISTVASTAAGYLAGPALKAAAPVVGEALASPVARKLGAKAVIKALGWKVGAIDAILSAAGKLGSRTAATETAEATAKTAAEKAASARMVQGMGAAAKEAPEELVAAGKRAIAANPAATLAAAGAQRTAGQMSPAWIQNDLAVVARRANAALTPDQMHIAEGLVREGGLSPVDAVLKVKAATKSVSAAADLMQRLGLPSDEEVARRVADRNATGRWQP